MRNQKKQPQSRKPSVPSTTPQNPSPGIMPSLFSGIFQGFSFGAGSSIAHNIFRSPITIESSQQDQSCQVLQKQYIDTCSNVLEIEHPEKCKQMLDDLQLICKK